MTDDNKKANYYYIGNEKVIKLGKISDSSLWKRRILNQTSNANKKRKISVN